MSAVEVVDATKRYGALRALDGVSPSVAPGEVLGRNGPASRRCCGCSPGARGRRAGS
jgi:ABC-type branched-subunit amino acid transport system ATPase component